MLKVFMIQQGKILIDNQIDKSKAGYKIFTPFYLNERKLIMIDRGWIPQGNTRNDLPDIAFTSSKIRVVGTLVIPKVGIVAGDELITNLWPKGIPNKIIEDDIIWFFRRKFIARFWFWIPIPNFLQNIFQ